jgi:hypothetical protein
MPRLSRLLAAAVTFVAAITVASATLAQAAPAGPPAITPESKAAGMKAAPALIAANHIPCTLVDARLTGNLKSAKGGTATLTEMACKEGTGYVVLVVDKPATTDIFDCMIADQPAANGKPGAIACQLPENANPSAGLQYWITQAGRNCTESNSRFIGMTTDNHRLYEVACTNGQGYVLDLMAATWSVNASNCLAYANGTVKCSLTTPDSELSEVTTLAASAGKCATVAKDRYMLSTQDGSDYFEIACPDGKGYVLHGDKTGALNEVIPCAQAYQIGDGCHLTDPRQAETQEAALYSGLSKSAGFDCTVAKYALFPQSDATKDIVEMACSNRPDGGVGIFPAKGAGQVFDCLRSQDEGYKCSFTPESAVYPKLSAALKAAGKGSCVVSNARAFARGDDGSDLIEVGCADGGSGWVMIFPAPGSPGPTQLLNCAQATSLNGGCQLPGNKKS